MSKSIYQTNGKPLSQQALYQQKLRQGVYNSPNISNVGVTSNASDTAALLAASTDLTVRPSYERTVAVEAQEAALAAKLEKVYQWSRTVDQDAASAATAGLNDYQRKSSMTSTNTYQSSSSQLGVPSFKGSSIYNAASKNSTSTMTSRINPDKNSRHGLLPKEANKTFDISKISSVANSNSTKTMDSRINPALSSKRSGLVQENRSKSFKASDISGQYLLAAASEKANNRLNSLSSMGKPEDFKKQAQLYANALTIAQQRSNERLANNKAGLIDLGGGLTVTQAELDAMASLIVAPVLSDIDSKAKMQRETDELNKKKKLEAIKQHDKAKRDEYAAKQQEKADLEAAKQERIQKNTENKAVKDQEFVDYQAVENAKVEEKLKELKEQEEKLAGEKEELITKKQENQDKIDGEELELIGGRKTVLDDMQTERDEEIAPVLEELKVESDKLKELTDAKDELSTEVEKLTSLNEEYTSKLKELEDQLKEIEEGIETHTALVSEKEQELTKTTGEVEELTKSTESELAGIDEEDKKLDDEITNLQDTKTQHLDDKKSKKEEIKTLLTEQVKEEHEINRELPEHLQKEVNEKKLLDTSSIFSDEPKPEPVAEVKAEKPSAKPETKATKTVKKDKPSRMKRLSNLFKSSKPVTTVKSAAKPITTPSASTKPAEEPSKVDVKSTASYDGFDEISVNKNKGGLFKEEI